MYNMNRERDLFTQTAWWTNIIYFLVNKGFSLMKKVSQFKYLF